MVSASTRIGTSQSAKATERDSHELSVNGPRSTARSIMIGSPSRGRRQARYMFSEIKKPVT
jgi:hypothetical protein